MAVVRFKLPQRQMRNLAERSRRLDMPRLTNELRRAASVAGRYAELTADEFRRLRAMRHPPNTSAVLTAASVELLAAEDSDTSRKERARAAVERAHGRFGIEASRVSDRERRFHQQGG